MSTRKTLASEDFFSYTNIRNYAFCTL